jgi:glycosyltransferase involved in cell wall biosynthesis
MSHLFYSKGIHDLIQAFIVLSEKYGNKIKLLLAGEKPEYKSATVEWLQSPWKEDFINRGKLVVNEVNQFISNKQMKNAIYLGVISSSDKKQYFNQSDIFILPSYSEGLSMACLEAMAMGLPVITTPTGAMPEVIIDGQNGIITPIGNPEKLAENIESLMLDGGLRKKMSENNIKDIKEKYDIEKIAEQLLAIIDQV